MRHFRFAIKIEKMFLIDKIQLFKFISFSSGL